MDMKKLLILLGLVVVLAACGNDTQADNETNNQEMDNESSDEIEENAMENESNELDELYSDVEVETEGDMLSVTDDPLIAGDINDGHIVFEDDFDYTYLIKDRYTNDETDEDGF